MVDTEQDLEGDLDFKIEIGDNADEPMESTGSNKLKKATIESSTESGKKPAAELTASQKKFVPRFLQGSAHPGYCILHLVFKILALICYLILGLLIDDKTFCFLVVIILSAIDFWVVKNVTGR